MDGRGVVIKENRAQFNMPKRSGHSKISKPLANHFLHRGNFYFVHHGIKNKKFINTNSPDILSRETREGKPFMHQTQGQMLDIIATGLRVSV